MDILLINWSAFKIIFQQAQVNQGYLCKTTIYSPRIGNPTCGLYYKCMVIQYFHFKCLFLNFSLWWLNGTAKLFVKANKKAQKTCYTKLRKSEWYLQLQWGLWLVSTDMRDSQCKLKKSNRLCLYPFVHVFRML